MSSTRTTPPGEVGSKRRGIVSYVHRGGRVTAGQARAWANLWPRLGRDVEALPSGPLDLAEWFDRDAPVVLEIGPGMGDATVAMAAARPDLNYLAVDVYEAGLAHLMMRAQALGVTNLRLLRGDAVTLLAQHIPPSTLVDARIFFPDPWPKKRHHKRRLIQPPFVSLVTARLVPGGRLHLATDWLDYATHMRAVCLAEPRLRDVFGGHGEQWAPRPDWRPVTKFESRARDEGRASYDLVFECVPARLPSTPETAPAAG